MFVRIVLILSVVCIFLELLLKMVIFFIMMAAILVGFYYALVTWLPDTIFTITPIW